MRLKIGLENDSNGHNFTFTSPVALAERESFKAQLTTIISNNRAAREAGALQSPQTSAPPAPSSANGAAHRAPAPTPSRPSTSRAESVSSTRGTPVNDPVHDFRIRKKVLVKTPELAALHRELVMSGQITETEFWEGREVHAQQMFVWGRVISDVRSCPSISCSRRPLPTRRGKADQANWLTRDHKLWTAVKSKLSLRHNSYTTSLMNIPSSPRRAMRTCRAKYRLLSHSHSLLSHLSYHSCLKQNFGNGIFNQNFFIRTGLPSAPRQPNTLSKTTQSSTSIWKNRMTVSFPCFVAAGPAGIIPPTRAGT